MSCEIHESPEVDWHMACQICGVYVSRNSPLAPRFREEHGACRWGTTKAIILWIRPENMGDGYDPWVPAFSDLEELATAAEGK